ncbi:MAG: ribonuclease H [Thermostichus sp. DG_1_6_bins_120]
MANVSGRPTRLTVCPSSGIFTDGGCSPNPGPGGWAVVVVQDNQVVDEWYGGDPTSTNNRMELTGLIQALEYCHNTKSNTLHTIYSDSHLCVQIYNNWIAQWAAQGWRRRTGPVENLDLVQQLYQLKQQCPHIQVSWIQAHGGMRWNEYADKLVAQGRLEAK